MLTRNVELKRHFFAIVASAAGGDAANTVTTSLSEAGLTMNETIERVRGTLRMAVDLLSETKAFADDDIESDGGSVL